MNNGFRVLIAGLVAFSLPSCSSLGMVCHGVCEGMYYGLGDMSGVRNREPVPSPPGRETPSYGQYQRMREEALSDLNEDKGDRRLNISAPAGDVK